MSTTLRTIRHGTLKLKDGGGNTLTLLGVEGGIEGDIFKKGKQLIVDRGVGDQVIELDDELLDVTLTFNFREFYGESVAAVSTSLKPHEFIMNDDNNASVTLTKVDTTWDPWNFDIELTMSNPTGAGTEVITWKKVTTSNEKFSEAYPNKLSFTMHALSRTIVSTGIT